MVVAKADGFVFLLKPLPGASREAGPLRSPAVKLLAVATEYGSDAVAAGLQLLHLGHDYRAGVRVLEQFL